MITTLLVIVVLSTIVVAFMQSMAVERMTARSLRNVVQAELAAQAGYDAAVRQIMLAMGTNQAFVTGQTNFASGYGPVLLIGMTNLTNSSQLMPLVSGPIASLASFPGSAWTNQYSAYLNGLTTTNSVDVNTRNRYIQNTNSTNLYRGNWVVLTNFSGATNARYAYVVLDEQARANPLIHNGSGSRTNSTNWYNGPQDIQLTNSGGFGTAILTPSQASALSSRTNYIWTPETLAGAFGTRADYDAIKHLMSVNTNFTFDVVSASLAGGGRPMYNVNLIATNAAFYDAGSTNAGESLGAIVSSNLSSFGSRDPSLRGTTANERRYVNRLAANIVDYIDPDSLPTAVNGGEPAGKDLVPLVTAIASQYRRTSYVDADPASATIESKCFVQVWNPYTSPIVLSNTVVRFVLKNRLRVTFGNGIVSPFNNYDQSTNLSTTIQPNEFAVLEFASDSKTWTSPGPTGTNYPYWGTKPSTVNTTSTADQTSWMPFEFYVNGQLVDMNRRSPVSPGSAHSGLTHNFKNFTTGDVHYQVNFIPTQSSSPTWRFVGDPRSTFLSNYDWGTPISSDTTFSGSTHWKGRQNAPSSDRRQEFTANWVNRDYVPRNPSTGNTPGSINTTPASVPSAYNPITDASAAVSVIKNAPMSSIGELGNIFDPIQAADDLTAPSGGTPGTIYVAGGGRTLRIGQPEFAVNGVNTWSTNGRRAIELLDILSVNSTNAASGGFPVAVGRFNVNTAPPEILGAVLSGIELSSDEGIARTTLVNLGAVATNIITNRPYSRLSDLSRILDQFAIATNYAPAFSSTVGGGTTNLAAADRVREEAFGKIIQHLTVQSRTYRIIVVGETLDSNGRVRGQAAVESIVYFQADASGVFRPVLQYQKYLK